MARNRALDDETSYGKMTEKQIAFHKRNDKRNPNVGKCRQCNRPTEWLEDRGKYRLLCGSQECKDREAERYKENIMRVHGTDNLMKDMDYQKNKLMANRRIAKLYRWGSAPNNTYNVLSMLEYKVLEVLDKRCKMKCEGVFAPAPFVMEYKLDGEKESKQHIPDIYVEDLNLIISVKDGLDNPNTHPSFKKDRLKSLCEYRHILNNTNYNFLQVEGLQDLQSLQRVVDKIKKMKNMNSRYISPPRIDFFMYGETVYDEDRVSEDEIFISIIVDRETNVGLVPYFSKCHNLKDTLFIVTDTGIVTTSFDTILNTPNLNILTYRTGKTKEDFNEFLETTSQLGFVNPLQYILSFITGDFDFDDNILDNIIDNLEDMVEVDRPSSFYKINTRLMNVESILTSLKEGIDE
ncbi:MAG: hypothetical protein ACRC92_25895 [Peptostreptococcaceae bacterium]